MAERAQKTTRGTVRRNAVPGREREPSAQDHSQSQRTPASAPVSVASVQMLQQTVGNMATTAIVQRNKHKNKGKSSPPQEPRQTTPTTPAPAENAVATRGTFTGKVSAFNTALGELTSTYKSDLSGITTSTHVTAASKGVKKLRDLQEAVVSYHEVIDTRARKAATEAEGDGIEDDDPKFQEKLEALGEESSDFDSLVRDSLKEQAKIEDKTSEMEGGVALKGDAIQGAAEASAELKRLRNLWTSAGSAKSHFDKHKDDTNLGTEQAYLARAEVLVNSTAGGTILTKVRDGDTLYFDTATGQFAVKRSDGKIRTLFCPSAGKSYYDKQ